MASFTKESSLAQQAGAVQKLMDIRIRGERAVVQLEKEYEEAVRGLSFLTEARAVLGSRESPIEDVEMAPPLLTHRRDASKFLLATTKAVLGQFIERLGKIICSKCRGSGRTACLNSDWTFREYNNCINCAGTGIKE